MPHHRLPAVTLTRSRPALVVAVRASIAGAPKNFHRLRDTSQQIRSRGRSSSGYKTRQTPNAQRPTSNVERRTRDSNLRLGVRPLDVRYLVRLLLVDAIVLYSHINRSSRGRP